MKNSQEDRQSEKTDEEVVPGKPVGGRMLRFLQWIVRQIKETVEVTWHHFRSMFDYGRSQWGLRSLKKASGEACLNVGKRLHALEQGDKELRIQIDQVNQRLSRNGTSKRKLERERNRLLIKLGGQPEILKEENELNSLLRQANQSVEEQEAELTEKRGRLRSQMRECKAHIGLGYAFTILFLYVSVSSGGAFFFQGDVIGVGSNQEVEEDVASRREVKKTEAEHGGVNALSWPPPDPVFKSAKDWHRQYLAAKPISDAEFLKQVPSVRLNILRTETVTKLLPEKDLRNQVVKAVESQGLRVDPTAPVRLDVTIFLGQFLNTDAFVRVRSGYASKDAYYAQCYSLIVAAEFVVPTRVYREGEFYHLDVSPARGSRLLPDLRFGKNNKMSSGDLRNYIKLYVGESVADLKRREAVGVDDPEVWRRSLWADASAGENYEQYLRSRSEKSDDLDRFFAGVSGVRPTSVSAGNNGAKEGVGRNNHGKRWDSEWRGVGIAVSPGSSVGVVNNIFAWWGGGLLKPEAFDVWTEASVIDLVQYNVVYPLNGKLVRGRVVVYADYYAYTARPNTGGMVNLVNTRMNDVIKQASFRR